MMATRASATEYRTTWLRILVRQLDTGAYYHPEMDDTREAALNTHKAIIAQVRGELAALQALPEDATHEAVVAAVENARPVRDPLPALEFNARIVG
jgi:hypothetical protein